MKDHPTPRQVDQRTARIIRLSPSEEAVDSASRRRDRAAADREKNK